MCDIHGGVKEIVDYLQEQMNFAPARSLREHPNLAPREWDKYALLVLVTKTDKARAVTYLEDTGDPKAATGRLLLRAAERSLREYGDTPDSDSDKQKGDEG